MKKSATGIQILRGLASEGLKIFSVDQAREMAKRLGIVSSYVTEALHHLLKDHWIFRVKRGVYALSNDSGLGSAPHEYAIAMALVSPCSISHWTAMHYHGLTQQTPNKIFATTPTGSSIPRNLKNTPYQFIQIKNEYFFGNKEVWIEESKILITELERTLLDGLIAPQYCGDIQEVLYAFRTGISQIDLDKIINYSLRLDKSIGKRLGFILDRLGVSEKELSPLLQIPTKTYYKLDPTGPIKGRLNPKWKIRENI